MKAAEAIRAHEQSGRRFAAAGVESFVLDAGAGDPVVCLHGVPSSSYLYRKVVPELADRGLRGVAFDLPGLGLAERPEDFDYTWTGLGRWCRDAVDALGLDRFHLVIHDIGGPIGCELAAAVPDRVLSLTVLNAPLQVATFHRPWSMHPFSVRGLGELWLASLNRPVFRALMELQAIGDTRQVSSGEIDAYLELLRRGDRGRAFLRIMRGFELTAEKQELYAGVLGSEGYPVQVVWGDRDPALKLESEGEYARRTAGAPAVQRLPGKHFLQEDCAPQIADAVAAITSSP